jgi:hypothetical protein
MASSLNEESIQDTSTALDEEVIRSEATSLDKEAAAPRPDCWANPWIGALVTLVAGLAVLLGIVGPPRTAPAPVAAPPEMPSDTGFWD